MKLEEKLNNLIVWFQKQINNANAVTNIKKSAFLKATALKKLKIKIKNINKK